MRTPLELKYLWLKFSFHWTVQTNLAQRIFAHFSVFPCLPEFAQGLMSIESVMPSNHLILCHSLLFLPSIFLASGSFPKSWLFASGGQSTGASASATVLPINIQGWFPLGLAGLISLQSKGVSRVFSSTTVWMHQFFGAQLFLLSSSHIHTWLLENHSFDYTDLCRQSNVCFLIHCLGSSLLFFQVSLTGEEKKMNQTELPGFPLMHSLPSLSSGLLT